MTSLISPAVKFLLHILGGLLGLAFLLAVLAVWRISAGPVSLAFLAPQVEQAMRAEFPNYQVRFEDIILTWSHAEGEGGRNIDIRGVGIWASQTGALVLVPEMSMELSLPALARGTIALTGLTLHAPHLRLVVQPDGEFRIPAPEEPDAHALMQELLAGIIAPADAGAVTSGLERVSFRKASISIDDRVRDRLWQIPLANVTLSRMAGGLKFGGSLSLTLDQGPVTVAVNGHYLDQAPPQEPALRIHTAFAAVRPAGLDLAAANTVVLDRLDLPLTGTIAVGLDRAGGLLDIGYDLAGGAGMVDLTGILNDSAPRPIERLHAKGRYDHRLSVLEVARLDADFDGVGLSLSGRFAGDPDRPDTEMTLALTDLPRREMDRYWPAGVASEARQWVLDRVQKGVLEAFEATLDLRPEDWRKSRLPAAAITGRYRIADATLVPIQGLPPLTGFAASAEFDGGSMTIRFTGGELDRLQLTGATALLSELGLPEERARITATGTGPVQATLDLLAMAPLQYTQTLGIDPRAFSGDMAMELHLNFPLAKAVMIEAMEVEAVADLANVTVAPSAFPDWFGGYQASECHGTLFVDRHGLDLTAQGRIGGQAAEIAWRENFGPPRAPEGAEDEAEEGTEQPRPFARRLDVRTTVTEAMRATLGFADPRLRGPVVAAVHFVDYGDGRWTGELRSDLEAADLVLPALAWAKPAATPGLAEAALTFNDGRLQSVDRFRVSAPGLEARGSAMIAGTEHVVRLDYVMAGATEGAVTVTIADDGGYTVAMDGKRLDLRPLLAAEEADQGTLGVPPMVLSGRVDAVIVDDKITLRDVHARAEHDGIMLRQADLTGLIGAGQEVRFRLEPAGEERRITLDSDNAGAVAQALGITDKLSGGRLHVDGVIDDGDTAHPVSGLVTVTGFHVVQAPFLAKFLSAASITGGLEMMQGKGLPFDSLTAPFTWQDGRLTLDRARANGVSLGLTATGVLDVDGDFIDLEGVIVPAYVLNSFVGNIPVIGEILTGGEGEGVFAAAYEIDGALSEPSIKVNPFSALTPGILRDLFKLFDRPDGAEVGQRRLPEVGREGVSR